MANERVCVFCGEKLARFHAMTVICADAYLPCCRTCYKELKDLPEEEQCRRALRLGLVDDPERLEKRIAEAAKRAEIAANAEAHRPSCLRCSTKMKFLPVQLLDNSPMRDSLFSKTFSVLPALCENCGKYEFFDPEIIKRNEYMARLIKTDTAE